MAVISYLFVGTYAAIGLGLIAAFRAVLFTVGSRPQVSSRMWEGSAFFAAIVCVVSASMMLRGALERGQTFVMAVAAAQLLFGIAAIGVFPTRWRSATEGLAATATGILSFITGFSIGIFIMPFALALGVAAWLHGERRVTTSDGPRPH